MRIDATPITGTDGTDWIARYISGLESIVNVETPNAGPSSFSAWARQRLWIRTKEAEVIQFQLNNIQKRYLAAKRLAQHQGRKPRYLLLKYRRGGFTTLEQGLSYRMAATQGHVDVVTLAHTADSAAEIFRIALLMHERDPDKPPIKGPGNSKRLDFMGLNSHFFIGTAGASGFGRGFTLQRCHGSEIAKWCPGPHQIEKQEEVLAGVEEACSHGEMVLETTANGVEKFCLLYREAKKGLNDWTPIFIPWFSDIGNTVYLDADGIAEIQDTLTDREREMITLHHLVPQQIAWRREKMRAHKRLFKQEYPEDDETCFLTSGTCFFDTDVILRLLENLPDYPRQHVPGGYRVEWEPPQPGIEYVMGCDTSEGLPGRDPNGHGILRRDTGAQVAALHGIFRPDKLAEHCAKDSERYNNAFMLVEREAYGHAVIQKLRDLGIKSERRLYHCGTEKPGWSTNQETRPVMLDDIEEAVREGFIKVNDKDFLSECLSFRLQGNNKYSADSGAHDDAVMKWAIAWQGRKIKRPRIFAINA